MVDPLALCRGALLSQPDDARHYSDLGVALSECGCQEAALRAYQLGLKLDPANRIIQLNSAVQLRRCGLIKQAREQLKGVLAQDATFAEARFNLALIQLSLGAFQSGWQLFESRFALMAPAVLLMAPRGPLWQVGQSVEQLWLIAEQGMGDVLHFIRWLPVLRRWAGELVLVVHPALVSLLEATKLADRVVAPDSTLRAFAPAAFFPLLSVPAALTAMGLDPQAHSAPMPILKRSGLLHSDWRQRLLSPHRRLVGLFWQGNPHAETGDLAGRSLPLQALEPVVSAVEAQFVALQKGAGLEQLDHCIFQDRFVAEQHLVNRWLSFENTAAVATACDLVITTDSAVAHLCGCLGVPTWLLLQAVPDWRWGLKGAFSPLYPSLTLFRQPSPGDWTSVVQAVACALPAFLARREPHADEPG